MEAGTGKTLIALNILRHKYNVHRQVFPTIVFCPIIVLNNWKREFEMCTKVPPNMIGVVMGTKAKRLKIIHDTAHKVLIVNYEATRSDEIMDALLAFRAMAVVGDESHKFKNHKLKTPRKKDTITGAVIRLSQFAKYKIIMSGTPVPKPEDIWSQYYFLDRGTTFDDRFYSFKSKYFMNKNANWKDAKSYPDWRFIESKTDEYKEKLSSKCVSMKREECVDLPDLVEKVVHIQPSPEMLKHYKELKNQLITWVEGQPDNPTVVSNALTKVLRLAEVLSGYLKLEDESIVKIKNNSTIDGLMELIESMGDSKVIVFCKFKQNYEDIARALEKKKIEYVEIHGGISTKQKLENVDVFNDMSNQVRVCIANAKSGGVGINLKAASYTVYYSLDYSLVDFEQSRARNYRSGSIDLHSKITHYFMCHAGLITQKILESVRNKKEFADNLLDLKGSYKTNLKKFIEEL